MLLTQRLVFDGAGGHRTAEEERLARFVGGRVIEEETVTLVPGKQAELWHITFINLPAGTEHPIF